MQREVRKWLAIEAGIRAGRLDAAIAILAARTAQRTARPDSVAATRHTRIDAAGAAAHHEVDQPDRIHRRAIE